MSFTTPSHAYLPDEQEVETTTLLPLPMSTNAEQQKGLDPSRSNSRNHYERYSRKSVSSDHSSVISDESYHSSDGGEYSRDRNLSRDSESNALSDDSMPPRVNERPRFDSAESWADSTRFDRADSRASEISKSDLRLSRLDESSRASRYSRASSSRGSVRSSVSRIKSGSTRNRALSTISENWDIPDDQFGSPFNDFDAQDAPIKEQLEKGLTFANDHAAKLRDIEDAITYTMGEVWGSWSDAVQLHMQPPEKVDVQDLVTTDNELFNKVVFVLCDEISELKVTAQANFFPAMIMFGQAKHGDESEVKPGEDELHLGRTLPFFQDVANFVDRCNSIAINIIHQLASLYHSFQKLWKSTFKQVHLRPVFDALGDLLEILITLDVIVLDNPNIRTAWDKYKRMMQYVRADPTRYDMTVERVKQFERLLVSLDQTIMGAQVLQSCIEQDFEASPFGEEERSDDEEEGRESRVMVDVKNNRVFLEEFFYCIKDRFDGIEAAIGTSNETVENIQLIGTFGLYALYRRLTPPNVLPDQDFYRRLWEIQRRAPCVTVCGKVLWYSAEFLLKYAPFAMKKLAPSDVDAFRREYLQHLDDSLPSDVQMAYLELSAWLIRMESFIQLTTRGVGDPARIISIRGNLLLKGLVLSMRVSKLMHTVMNLHLALSIPMQKRVVRSLCQCVEILKAIEFMYARKNHIIAESIALITVQIGQSIQAFFRPVKAKLEASKRFDDTKLDILAAVTVVEEILRTGESFSYTRLTVLSLAMRIALICEVIQPKQADEVLKLLWKLQLLSDWQRKLRKATDCSFLYWSRELLSTFIDEIYAIPEQASRMQYVLAGFSDAVGLLHSAQHEESNVPYIEAYQSFTDNVLEAHLVKPLCNDIENDLRLHIHSVHLDHLEAPNPKSANFKVLLYYLDMQPLRVMGKFLDLRQRVIHHLENIFYDLTTVALHDWKTYDEMKNLANDKYGLALAENHLPMGSLDQGLDILQIMRNIHIFVSRYNYNLNQQFFLERRSDTGSRHLNAINIHSIASSIRTHGMGIMNTTVNFTYQFLTKKFDVFSQFLFDEYIKSHLQRERRWYSKQKDKKEIDNKYPYERSFQFNKDIRKLGVSDTGKTFIDQFRLLITEIGNALGYVRMVRSAGMNYCSLDILLDLLPIIGFNNAIKFVPDLNTNHFKFAVRVGEGSPEQKNENGTVISPAIPGANLSKETIGAAVNLDSVIANLSKNFSENNDYFKVLVQVFQDVMVNDQLKHLNNFYMIIPALTINFVETSVQAKDLMYKNSRRKESYFSDDGFAIGLAYILAILNQGEKFDALHWFDAVSIKYQNDEDDYQKKQSDRETRKKEQATRKLKETTAELIDDEEEIHTLQLTAKRIEQHRREFDLLNWSLNGARIFFKD